MVFIKCFVASFFYSTFFVPFPWRGRGRGVSCIPCPPPIYAPGQDTSVRYFGNFCPGVSVKSLRSSLPVFQCLREAKNTTLHCVDCAS